MQWEEASDCAKTQTDSFEISLYRKTNKAGYDQSPRLTSVGDLCKPLSAPFLPFVPRLWILQNRITFVTASPIIYFLRSYSVTRKWRPLCTTITITSLSGIMLILFASLKFQLSPVLYCALHCVLQYALSTTCWLLSYLATSCGAYLCPVDSIGPFISVC